MALFDTLAREVTYSSPEQAKVLEVDSVCKHLNYLLNSHCGVLSHLPKYGLTDIQNVYGGLPYSQKNFAAEIKDLIEHYEPRVKHIIIDNIDIIQKNYVIKINLRVFLVSGQSVQLSTQFLTGGVANVSTTRDV